MPIHRGTIREIFTFALPGLLVGLLITSGLSGARAFPNPSPVQEVLSSAVPPQSSYHAPRQGPSVSALGAGSVSRTVFINYNASWEGNFHSSVTDWSVGPGAFVPPTGYL